MRKNGSYKRYVGSSGKRETQTNGIYDVAIHCLVFDNVYRRLLFGRIATVEI